jgi:UDP-N-acetylglucosamine 2-epimerase (hydrolysing)
MKKILFLTGTRADYGKLKPLIKTVENDSLFECHLFITGMHTMSSFGTTKSEVINDGYSNIHVFMNQIIEEPMDLVLANTINGFSRYLNELKPDLVVVLGDRVESLAAAISGALNNILVAHIEGGEVSGTIDESIRHAITKFSHVHFVSNESSEKRLVQLGEKKTSIFVIGSPDLDVILSKPQIELLHVRKHYNIKFSEFGIAIFHPVTTELDSLADHIREFVDALIQSEDNIIIILPNNDPGFRIIISEFERVKNNPRFAIFPSIRFEYFIELLRNSKFIIGNSSSGIIEAPILGVPTINVGSRQENRSSNQNIFHCKNLKEDIISAVYKAKLVKRFNPNLNFGLGNSARLFLEKLKDDSLWNTSKQKKFYDLDK